MKYLNTLTTLQIISLFRSQTYIVNFETGTLINKRGKVITPFVAKDGYALVRLYANGSHRKAIGLAKAVWIAKTLSPIPKNFEIHHRDKDPSNNSWQNLICLHRKDHEKLHNDGRGLVSFEDEIPF